MRRVHYLLEFPNPNCPPANAPPAPITVLVETGATVHDVMIAAANVDNSYNFKTTYFGDNIIGFYTEAIGATANAPPCFWWFFFQMPGLPVTFSPLGTTNVVVPGDEFTVIFRYQKASDNTVTQSSRHGTSDTEE